MMSGEWFDALQPLFPQLESFLSEEQLSDLANLPEQDGAVIHLGLGLWIRKHWLYPQDSALFPLFIKANIRHSDEMSERVIAAFQQYLRQKQG